MYQYLANHKRDHRGMPKNTNAEVFDQMNRALLESEFLLQIFRFDSCLIGNETVDYSAYSTDPHLFHAVEALLICLYRRHGHCKWNRD